MSRIVIVGGVAAGMSAASQAKRRQPQAEVIALERGPYVSYGACGMPYNLMDPKRAMQDLVVISPERFRSERHIDVRTRHEAMELDCRTQRLRVRDHEQQRDYDLDYDRLVLATGAEAVMPPLSGLELPGVFVLRELEDGVAIKQRLARGDVKRAVIIGAGYIGMEMCEALKQCNVEVTVIEQADQVLPGFHYDIAQLVEQELLRHGVSLHKATRVEALTQVQSTLSVETTNGNHAADLVLVSVGVRPRTSLAAEAGIELGVGGAIAVDRQQRTGHEHVYAAGDCAEVYHRVLQENVYFPLGTTANKQGKIAGANVVGRNQEFAGIVGTAAFKVFDLEVGRTGLGPSELAQHNIDAVMAASKHKSRGHHYPGSVDVHTILFVERESRRLLGAQMLGAAPVAKRIDIFATALYASLSVDDVASLDLSYAPPLAPVYDPVIIAAAVAQKAL